jgi:hypothetical protein
MPNQPKTANRVIRIPDVVWSAIQHRADMENVTASDVVRKALYRDGFGPRPVWRCIGAGCPNRNSAVEPTDRGRCPKCARTVYPTWP